MKRSSADLKSLARASLSGRFGLPMAAFLLTIVFVLVPSMILSGFLDPYNTVSLITNQILIYILSLLVSLCNAGFSYMLLNMNRNRPYGIKDLFYAFSSHPDRFLVVHLILLLISFVIALPLEILSYVPDMFQSLMFSLAGTLVSSIVSIFTGLFFGLADFLLLDHPEMGALESMRKSMELMKGKKGKLFYIHISFLPLSLVGLFTCYLGYLWIVPYINCTVTYFYMDIIGELDRPASSTDEAFTFDPGSYY